MIPRFERFACIDWSGAATRWHKGIAVAVCDAGAGPPRLVPPPERHWTRAEVLQWLLRQAGERMLIGFDFSAALPFDPEDYYLGADGPATAPALWALVEAVCAADPHLAATGFVALPAFAERSRVGGVRGARFGAAGGGRLRRVEQRSESGHPSSCFNLVGAKQVGRASLTGMRVLHRLGGAIPVWPFDPPPAEGALLVEVYTGIAARAALGRWGRSKLRNRAALDAALATPAIASAPTQGAEPLTEHETDALLTAAWLRRAADVAGLWVRPTDPVAMAEGWTFGVPYRMERQEPG